MEIYICTEHFFVWTLSQADSVKTSVDALNKAVSEVMSGD